MEMSGSSSALDVLAPTQDMKFMLASNVNFSNFVSVKLTGLSNYTIWKAQMLCLIKSQVLLNIIDDDNPFPEDKGVHMITQYDELVKGWIFGSINEKILMYLVDMGTAQEVWMKLEHFFNKTISEIEEGDLPNELEVPASDVLAPLTSAIIEDLKFIKASNVNVSNFVSVKFSGKYNYKIWSAQMICLLESQELLYIIDDKCPLREWDNYMFWKFDKLVRGWIFGSMNGKAVMEFRSCKSARDVWDKVKSSVYKNLDFTIYTQDEKFMSHENAGYSSDDIEDMKFLQTSNVNLSSFVSVKLSGLSNYKIWKSQMLCFLGGQRLLKIIGEGYDRVSFPWNKGDHIKWQYERLVRGWIFSSMNENLLMDFVHLPSAEKVWRDLKIRFDLSSVEKWRRNNNLDPVKFKFGKDLLRDAPEMENTPERLYDAAIEGCWWKAKSILKVHKYAATEPITENGNTILHLVVERGHNYFLEKLLDFVKDGKDIEKKNQNGQTPLHIAAMVGNTQAAQLLVQKRKELLQIEDSNGHLPWYIASKNTEPNISAYLLKYTLPSDLITYPENIKSTLMVHAIFSKQYYVVREFIAKFPEFASEYDLLGAITITFPSDLSFMESIIYPSFSDVYQEMVVRKSLLFNYNVWYKCVDDILWVVKICSYGWLRKFSMILLVLTATLYPMYRLICLLFLGLRLTFSMVYFLLWKLATIIVPPIKNIERKKKEYIEAKKTLSLICDHINTSEDFYTNAIIEAASQDIHEVVDEILFREPSTINCKSEEGYNIIQLAIINRSEKVYNLIRHIIERTESYRILVDSYCNTHAHLVGRLAPSFVLDRTTGAAFQLQKELLWREEVEKLLSPLQLKWVNINLETPPMVFTREHQDLIKQGENWMKTTAESCSITAALIVTVVFASAITVPGGSNQESGVPVFRKEIPFTVFAISNAFSLFTAATALLLFLSILTARFSERDFLISLPRRLIFGLLMLFLSTTSMMVAFGAILFLVFCDQRPWMLAPICGFACLPISVIVTIKVPLLVDLIKSTYFPIFSKKNFCEPFKTNKKNTVFMD